MAEKRKNSEYKREKETEIEKKAHKPDVKKIVVVVLVMAVIVAISMFVDNNLKNPPVTDVDDACNRLTMAGVLSTNPEIGLDTHVSMEPFELEQIDGKHYYPIEVILHYDSPEAKVLPRYYVEQKKGTIYQADEQGKLVEWGV